MKKKLVILFVLVIGLFMITGCNKVQFKNNRSNAQTGKLYKQIGLNDKKITMFTSIIPKEWTASIYSQDQVNSSQPFVETIVIKNPDETAQITILSGHSFVENSNYSEGVNKEYYTTYLHAMNASEYLDYFMSRIYKDSSAIKDKEVDSNILKDLKQFHDLQINLANQDINNVNPNNYGVYITIGDEGYSSSLKEYQNGNTYYEASTSVSSISSDLKSQVSSMLDSKSIYWYMPYVIIYEATSKEAYDKYYDDYKFIIANSSFTKDYYALIEYVSSAITNSVTSVYAQRAQAALEATNNYIDSNYSSDSSSSTQDKVREMWSDVINERDNYVLEDGSSIKTSIHSDDVIAQNKDEIYIGSKSGIPNGFNQVAKGYN